MCLGSVLQTYPPNDNMVVGYKVFDMANGKPETSYRGVLCEVGKHHVATNGRIRASSGRTYEIGFHFFESFEDAKDECIPAWRARVYEVHLWDIRVVGMQWGKFVGVAKNMRIIGQVKEDSK